MIENCDAMTPAENLAKGSKIKTNRYKWQDEFFQKYLEHSEPNFFLCALPGGGKTKASIRIAVQWIKEGGKIVVIVPTLPIKRNWQAKLAELKIYVDKNFYGFIKERYHGIVTTYSGLHNQVSGFRKLCADHSILLICDEIHHASENESSAWGIDLREGFQLAKRRLLLSGTPVRSDKEATTFLAIEDDPDNPGKHRYKMHFLYDWPRALKDTVVRKVVFHRIQMDHVNVEFPNGKKSFSNNEDSYLYYALDDKDFILMILRRAIEKLHEFRKSDPSAAAMAIAKDVPHARKLVKLLQQLGQRPVLVTSQEEEDSADVIDDFCDDKSKLWIISVKQVSEGVDIPRLRVLAYLTNTATDLAFRQFIGRVVRRRENELDENAQASIFIPETKSLVALAEKIEKLQALAMKKSEGGKPPTSGDIGVTIGGSIPQFVGYVIHGQHYTGDHESVVNQLMEKYKINEISAALMLADSNFAQGLKAGEEPIQTNVDDVNPPWIEEEALKSENNNLASQLCKIRQRNRKLGIKYDRRVWENLMKEINTEFMIDRTSQTQLSVSQLKRKIDKLREAIMREQICDLATSESTEWDRSS